MGEIVNLRKARKAKVRVKEQRRAEENRVRFGRSRAERDRDKALNEIERGRIEAHRRDDDA